jgi:beta-galactosidase GanA
MMANLWIVQQSEDLPGVYTNGGPVSRVMDIWKAAAPAIDIQSPDIYLPNFKEIVAMYHRADKPLLIP